MLVFFKSFVSSGSRTLHIRINFLYYIQCCILHIGDGRSKTYADTATVDSCGRTLQLLTLQKIS